MLSYFSLRSSSSNQFAVCSFDVIQVYLYHFGVLGLLNNQPEKVILAALTTKMHQKGSKFLDELIVAVDIAFPQTFSKAVLENTEWKSLLQDFATTTSLAVDIKVSL